MKTQLIHILKNLFLRIIAEYKICPKFILLTITITHFYSKI